MPETETAEDLQMFQPTHDDRAANVLETLRNVAAAARSKCDRAEERVEKLDAIARKAERALYDFERIESES